MVKTIYRYEVPADWKVHVHELTGRILHVGCRRMRMVEFWAEHLPSHPARQRAFTIFGTGDTLPDTATVIGTAIDGPSVWHLVELVPMAPTNEGAAAAAATPSIAMPALAGGGCVTDG